MRILFLALSFCIFLSAKNFTEISKLPSSNAKDFYIWKSFKEDKLSKQEALSLYVQLKRHTTKQLKAYVKNSNDKYFKEVLSCKENKNLGQIKNHSCLLNAISPYKVSFLYNYSLDILIKKLKNYENFSYIKMMRSKDFYNLNENNIKDFVLIFTKTRRTYRRSHFLKPLSFKQLKLLEKVNIYELEDFIFKVVNDSTFKNLQKSLIYLDTKNLSARSLFYLGINAGVLNKKATAINYLNKAYKKYYKRKDKDKALFWLYMFSKDKKYLQKLVKSFSINVYTIYANDILKTNKLQPVFLKTPTLSEDKKEYYDPFFWLKLSRQIRKTKDLNSLSSKFQSKEALPYKAYIIQRQDLSKSIFITPYEEILKNKSEHIKSLIYALTKQESLFIPPSVSTSFALGSMQFMPFVAKAIAKQKKKT